MLRRLARGCLALAPAAMLAACYKYVAVDSAPAPGIGVEVVLNDVGRVDMAKAVGPNISVIDGLIASTSDSNFVVSVQQVLDEQGNVNKWEGEQVTVRPGYVRTMSVRQFSVGRTVVATAMASAGFLAFALSVNLNGEGGTPSSSNPGSGKSQ